MGNPSVTVRLWNQGNATVDVKFVNPDYCYNCGNTASCFGCDYEGATSVLAEDDQLEKYLGSQIFRGGDYVHVFWRLTGVTMDWISGCIIHLDSGEGDMTVPFGGDWCVIGVDTFLYCCIDVYNQSGKNQKYQAWAQPSSPDTVLVPTQDLSPGLESGLYHRFTFTAPGLLTPPPNIAFSVQNDVTWIGGSIPFYYEINYDQIEWFGNTVIDPPCLKLLHGYFFANNSTNGTGTPEIPGGNLPQIPNLTNQSGLIYPTNWVDESEGLKQRTFMRGIEAVYGAQLTYGDAINQNAQRLSDTNWIRLQAQLEKMRTNSASGSGLASIQATNTDGILTNIDNKLGFLTNQSQGWLDRYHAWLTNANTSFGSATNPATGTNISSFIGEYAGFTTQSNAFASAGPLDSFYAPDESIWHFDLAGHDLNVNPFEFPAIVAIAAWVKQVLSMILAAVMWWYCFKRINWTVSLTLRIKGSPVTVPEIITGGTMAAIARVVVVGALALIPVNYFLFLSDASAFFAEAFGNPINSAPQVVKDGLWIMDQFVPIAKIWLAFTIFCKFEFMLIAVSLLAWIIIRLGILSVLLALAVPTANCFTVSISNSSTNRVAVILYAASYVDTSEGYWLVAGPASNITYAVPEELTGAGPYSTEQFGIVYHNGTNWVQAPCCQDTFGGFFSEDYLNGGSKWHPGNDFRVVIGQFFDSAPGGLGFSVSDSPYVSFGQGWGLGVALFGGGLAIFVIRRLTRSHGGDL